jgi:hypothetical protein
MARLIFALSAIAVLLSGCDPVYPPQFINAYGTPITVTLRYSDGHATTTIWGACLAFFIGDRDVRVENVTLASGGKVLREFNSSEIRAMLERERNESGYFAWIVSPEGVKPVSDRKEGPCPQS